MMKIKIKKRSEFMCPRIMPRHFNNTIKIVLLFLIWTLIWRRNGIAIVARATEASDGRAIAPGNDSAPKSVVDAVGATAIFEENHIDGGSALKGLPASQFRRRAREERHRGGEQWFDINETMTSVEVEVEMETKTETESGRRKAMQLNNEIGWRQAEFSTEQPMLSMLLLQTTTISRGDATARKAIDATTTIDDGNYGQAAVDNTGKPSNVAENDTTEELANELAYDVQVPAQIEDEVDVKVEPADKEQQPAEMALTASLQQQLIHNFAIKYKQIARVTLFTCRNSAPDWHNNNNNDMSYNKAEESYSNMNTMEILKRMYMSNAPSATATGIGGSGYGGGSGSGKRTAGERSQQPTLPKGVLIKVVQIDQLISKRHSGVGILRGGGYGGRGAAAASVGYEGYAYGGVGRNSHTYANWLEQVLRSDARRQIVVLDLSCGAASRRLIEMASNKALFNSTYHWLLIEDYAFNRKASDVADDNNSNGNNNDNDNNLQTEAQTTVGALTSGGGRTRQDNSRTAVDNRQQQQQPQQEQQAHQKQQRGTNDATDNIAANAGAAVTADESDMETIEKILEKININIDTELILAKRIRTSIPGAGMGLGAATAMGMGDMALGSNINSNGSSQSTDYYSYTLYDVWNPGLQYGGQLNISEIGKFALDEGFTFVSVYQKTTTIIRRSNMQMARVRCMIVITNKNLTDTLEHYLTTHYDTHLDSLNRFNFALLSHVRDLYNFSFVLSKTASWGYLKNGKFDGMIGALTRKQADIGGSPIFFRIERAKVIDYTTRTWVARPCFIFRHPRSTQKDRIVFLQPFSKGVWILVSVCGISIILLLWLLTSLETKLYSEQDIGCLSKGRVAAERVRRPRGTGTTAAEGAAAQTRRRVTALSGVGRDSAGATAAVGNASSTASAADGGYRGVCRRLFARWGNILCGQDAADATQRRAGLFFESVLFYIGSICQQGLVFSTGFFSGRCIIITSLLFSFSIYQFYSASIVGTLLMEKPKTIRTLRDLVHSSLEIGIEDIVYNRDYFLRTKDPDALELYAKKVTAVPMNEEQRVLETPPDAVPAAPVIEESAAAKTKSYRQILHSHKAGAHAKTNEASNWYDPEFGVARIKKGRFAFHVDVATAYKIISDTFTEKEICDLTEIQLFPPQKMVNIVQKGSPLRKIITYGLRRVTEVGLMDYQRKVWHSPKPRCVKQIHTDDLRVDMQTFTSAFLVLLFGFVVSLLTLGMEIMHHKLQLRFAAA